MHIQGFCVFCSANLIADFAFHYLVIVCVVDTDQTELLGVLTFHPSIVNEPPETRKSK